MKELDLDVLFKVKREEPTSVSLASVDSWLKGGIAFAGLLASIKWLFTKKMWLMLTSITSISIVSLVAIVQLNSTPKTVSEVKKSSVSVSKERHYEQQSTPALAPQEKTFFNPEKVPNELLAMHLLLPSKLPFSNEEMPLEQLPFGGIVSEPKDQFTRIDANGFVHFTLVNGTSCSIQNTIAYLEDEPKLRYTIKNGTLYLNSSSENNATDLIITVANLEKIKLNGFCELVTNSTFDSDELEIDVNGFTNFNVDLNVKDLEIDMNGETKGTLNLKSINLDYESNGYSDVEIECDVKQSRIEVNGFSTIELIGQSTTTIMSITGESKLSAEEFVSQDMFLIVSGMNKKIETAVTAKLDVEVSGENTVVIHGSPEIVHQEVTDGSRLKIK